MNDVLNLIPLLNELEQADQKKIGMFGGSRGGMMTYISLTKSNKIKAVAVLGAPSGQIRGIKRKTKYGRIVS